MKGDFSIYMDDQTKLFGISDSDGNIIVNAKYDSLNDMGELYTMLVLGEIDKMSIPDKEQWLEDNEIETLRVCENCGKLMHEGYTLAGEHACSDECAINLYVDRNGNVLPNAEELFNEDIENNGDDCYWTAWE